MENNEQEKGGAAGSEGSGELGNLKAEFNRKIGNISEDIKKQNEALLTQVAEMLKPKKPVVSDDDKPLKDKWWDDPEEAAAEVQRRTEAAIERKLTSQQAIDQKKTSMINQLVSQFPELNDINHSLTKRALEIYNSMDASEKSNPLSYDAAVKTAALEEGVKPMHKRSEAERESFSFGSGSGAAKARKSEPKLTDNALAFAKVMGLNIDDKKTVERLKKRFGRDYSKPSYE